MSNNIWKAIGCLFIVLCILGGCDADIEGVNSKTLDGATDTIAAKNVYDDFSIQISEIGQLLNGEITGIIYFGRDTCSFCLAFNSFLGAEYERIENLKIYKFDTDIWRENSEYQAVLDRYGIKSVPALIKIDQNGTFVTFVPDETANDEEVQQSLQSFLMAG